MSDRKVAGIILSEMDAQKLTEQLNEELLEISSSSHNLQYHTVTIEKDGQTYEIEVPSDDIDLLDDMYDEDLTEEGERSLGIISSEFDTTEGNAPVKTSRSNNSRVKAKIVNKVKVDQETNVETQYTDYEIVCPFTGSNEVYQISSNVFASYETDQPFTVEFDEED